MALPIIRRFKNAWNAFQNRDPTGLQVETRMNSFLRSGYVYTERPDRFHYRMTNAKAIVAKIYNRLALDVASVNIVHAKVDKDGNYVDTIRDGLNECLNLSANTDQTGMAFKLDAAQSLFDEGCIALAPIDTDKNPTKDSESYEILSLRVGKVVGWHPYSVDIECFNEETGRHETLYNFPKASCAIVENPFWSVMNEPNSTLQQLLRTIKKLDAFNDQNASGKLDLIIQLPYVIKSEQRRAEAEKRRKDLEEQLDGSALGIGYIDGTEKVVQLNRSLENNLWTQVKELQTQLYNELGLTQGIIDGTADEQASINYFNHTIAPICEAICQEMTRKFLSRTARSQGQSVIYFRDPFNLVTLSQLGDIADKLRRNEIMSSNEIRSKIGLRPSDTTDANSLRNPNLNKNAAEVEAQAQEEGMEQDSADTDDQNTETDQEEEPDYVSRILDGEGG